MRALRRARHALALATLLALVGCGAIADLGDSGGERLQNGTLVVGVDQEPAILNPWLSEGNLQATHSLTLSMLYPLWRVTPDFTYEPLLLDGRPKVSRDPFTVTYTLKEEATWSDGVPITAEDIRFTLQTCLDPDFNIAVRAGCQKVDLKASEIVDDKTFKMVFKEPYAPWRSLFSSGSGAILPAHVLEGKDFNDVWDDGITVSSGPLKSAEWNRGQDLTLVANEQFWGETKPAFDRFVFRFIEDSTVQVQALRGGEIDMLSSQAQLDLVDRVEGIDGVVSEAVAGGVWEFFEFNHGVKGLGDGFAFVREAIAMGINREELVDVLIAPMNPDAEPLNSLIYVNSQAEYDPAFQQWSFDPEGARRLLDEHGCIVGDDGIRTCDGVRLSFEFGYTSGNELRELQFVILQSYLKDIGIELTPAAEDSATYFGETWPAGEEGAWELFDQAWLNSADPDPVLEFWECDGALNYRSYCNKKVDALIQQSRTEPDPERRVRLLNKANSLMADDLPALPLYQKPAFLAWSAQIEGPQPNPTNWGHLWNVEEWAPR